MCSGSTWLCQDICQSAVVYSSFPLLGQACFPALASFLRITSGANLPALAGNLPSTPFFPAIQSFLSPICPERMSATKKEPPLRSFLCLFVCDFNFGLPFRSFRCHCRTTGRSSTRTRSLWLSRLSAHLLGQSIGSVVSPFLRS